MKRILGVSFVLFVMLAPFAVFSSPRPQLPLPNPEVPALNPAATTSSQTAAFNLSSPGTTVTWYLIFFHTNLLTGLGVNSHVTAGQLIGHADLSLNAHDFDVGIDGSVSSSYTNSTSQSTTYQSTSQSGGNSQLLFFDSVFNHMSPTMLQAFAARGITSGNIIVSKATRDASLCDFSQPASQDSWVVLSGATSTSTATSTAQASAGSDFVVATPFDLSQIQEVSKFRSCAGHDYSNFDADGYFETNRSMKHYFAPIDSLLGTTDQVKVFAPFNGTISQVMSEQVPRGKQVWITPDVAPSTTSTASSSSTTPPTTSSVTTPTSATTASLSTTTSITSATTSSTSSTTKATVSTTTSSTSPTTSATSQASTGSASAALPTSSSTSSSSSSASTASPATSQTSPAPGTASLTSTVSAGTTATATQNGGAVPELPPQALAVLALTSLVVASYLAMRDRQLRRRESDQ